MSRTFLLICAGLAVAGGIAVAIFANPIGAVPVVLTVVAAAFSVWLTKKQVAIMGQAGAGTNAAFLMVIALLVKVPVFCGLMFWAARLGLVVLAVSLVEMVSVYSVFVWDAARSRMVQGSGDP